MDIIEKAEGVIITQIEKREIGLHKLIMEAGSIIAPKHMEEYVIDVLLNLFYLKASMVILAAELAMYLNVTMRCSMMIHGFFYLKI